MDGQKKYPGSWHEKYHAAAAASANAMLVPLLRRFSVASILEVGCGHGVWSRVALDVGISDLVAIDGAWTERSKLVIPTEHFREVDLDRGFDFGRRFDLALSLEVGEHLQENAAPGLVKNLARHSDVIMFGAAIPFQGGYGHLNERWQSYWAHLFAELGFKAFDVVRPTVWSNAEIPYYYRQNTLLYVNATNLTAISVARGLAGEVAESVCLDLVHPEKYEAVASYNTIAFKRLGKKIGPGLLATLWSRFGRN